MGKRVPYGRVDFKSIREEGFLYIDKTMYIEKLEANNAIIFTRPRRFGKSMLTSMLGYYYSIGEAENFEKIFKGLYVYEHQTPYKNSYYVLQLNFSGIDVSEYKSLDEIERSFNNKIQDSLRKFIGVNNLEITFDKTRTAAGMLSEVLMKFSELHKKNNIYIMIDEYDHFTNGMLYGDAKRFLKILGNSGFVRAFYEVIKENLEGMNPAIGRFFATGVAPVTLDSLTSGFNIATKLTNNPIFTAMCGLTEEEVKYAIKESGVQNPEEAFNKMRENYDGYMFNKYDKTHLFNTTLVMYYLNSLQMIGMPPDNLVDSNLAATGSKIENIASLINKNANYKVLDELLMDGEIGGNIVDSFEIENHFDKNDFLSMLFYNGYITIESVGVRNKLKIPNYVTKRLLSKINK